MFDLYEGMKVYIRDDLVIGRSYGCDTFVSIMQKGYVTIDSIRRDYKWFCIKEETKIKYHYTYEMIDWDKTGKIEIMYIEI